MNDIMELYENRAAERQRGEVEEHMESEEGSELSEDLAGDEEMPEGDVEQEEAARRAATRRRQQRRQAKLEKLVQVGHTQCAGWV